MTGPVFRDLSTFDKNITTSGRPEEFWVNTILYKEVKDFESFDSEARDLYFAVKDNPDPFTRRGALLLPAEFPTYTVSGIIYKLAKNGIVAIVRGKDMADKKAKEILSQYFSVSKNKPWVEDLKNFKESLPSPKDFDYDPVLEEYFENQRAS